MKVATVAFSIMPDFCSIRRAMPLLAALFSLSQISAQDNPPFSLFDGKSLRGWNFDPKMWRVEEGVITGGSTTEKIKRNSFISTQQSFQNFELKLTIKCSGDPETGLINSGIQIRSTHVPGNGHVAGYQVDCGEGWFGKIYDEGRRRAPIAEPVDAAVLAKAVDVHGWNQYRILADGPRIQVWINDVLATDFTETNPKVAWDGFIAPQVHSGGVALVQIKDITLRELPATPDAPTWDSLGGVKEALKLAPRVPQKPKPKAFKKATASLPPLPQGPDRINFDFEGGDLQGWYIAEGWFAHPIANNEVTRQGKHALNKEGTFYLGTLEQSAGGSPNDQQTGILESPVFQLNAAEIQFALSGGSHEDTYLALCTLDGKEVRKASAQNSEIFVPLSWQVPELVDQPVFLRLVDQRKANWAHIVLDAFSAKGKLLPDETAKRKANAKPKKPAAPPTRQRKKTQSTRTRAMTPAEQLAGFTVPPGFIIELVASEEQGVINPIDISFDDRGRLWTQTASMYPLDPIAGIKWQDLLKLMDDQKTQQENPAFQRIKELYQLKKKGEDKILILENPTLPATEPLHVWADGLSIPQSILPYKDGAYVCHGSELFLLRDTDGDDKSDTMEPVLTGFGFTDTHTMSHLLVRGPGSYIHFTQGALNKGTVTAVASGKQAEVNASCQVRFTLDHQDFEVVSSGPSNMWGLQLRANGEWYGTEANDRAYSIIPWEHGTAVTGAAFHPMRDYQPLLPNLHDFRVGGTGISGLEFSDDAAGSFPVEEWKNVALLGNGITSTINAVRVHRNPNGTVEAEHLPDFLTSKDDWFRPVNLEFGPDGCLYVADFYNKIISHNEVSTAHPDRDHSHGRIWRIRHESQKPRAIPDLTKATPAQLLEHLKAPSLWEKRAAWHQIGDRSLKDLGPELVSIAADEQGDPITRIHALWSLEELRHYNAGLLGGLLASTHDDLRREAVRSLASFELEPAEVARLLAGFIEDPNCMVRSQTIRTLGDLKTSDPAVLAILIEACKPALRGNALGGSYERNFERFLARMALEKFPAELESYLDTSLANHPASHVLWAIQALDDEPKQATFLKIWEQVSSRTLDSETFVAITSMLSSKEVEAALQPTFQDFTKAKDLVGLALANQSRVQSPQLVKMLSPAVAHLLESPETQALALNAIGRFKIATLAEQVAAISTSPENLRLLLSAQAVNPEQNASNFQAIATNEETPLDLRISATLALAPVNETESYRIAQSLASGDESQKSQLTNQFSQSPVGAKLLSQLVKSGELTPANFDLSAAERMSAAIPRDAQARAVIAAAREVVVKQRKQAQTRIQDLMAKITAKPGNPNKGEGTFNACLACHQVGSEGQNIAPPLDGSGHRELESLLTAIVDPDAAVEGGYGLYRITKTDGSVVEGHLDKEEALGTTVAVMGGGRIFVPQEEIKKASFVGGRSFMPAMFGQMSDDMIADLVAYIGTLKGEEK